MTDRRSSNSGLPVLIIGGGYAGVSAAIEASETGLEVYLVEKNPYLGGRVVQMHKYFPKMCPPTCGMEIHLKRLRTTPRVHVLTSAVVTSVSGRPGAFSVEVEVAPRGVNEKCTNCAECVPVCPKERPNTFNYGLDTTKAIYLPHASAHPYRHAIDFQYCDGEACAKCKAACKYDAIELSREERAEKLEVGAIIVATGWKPYDAKKLENLGYGQFKNVVTNVEFERMAAADGPTGGKVLCPGDKAAPRTVAFVQCAGSRDENHLAYCSAVCCSVSMKQARYVLEQYPESKVHIFYIDRRTPGRLEDFLQGLEGDERVKLTKGKVAKITADSATGPVKLTAEDTLSGQKQTLQADLAVLATGLVPESLDARFPASWTVEDEGFLVGGGVTPGVFAVGCAKRPSDVATVAKDSTGAVLYAMQAMICRP
ncbi:MAG: FAD-dependent oxidoreductase [Planctomycetota bacterium]